MPGTQVDVVDERKRLIEVISVDTDTNTVTCYHVPLIIAADGETAAVYTLRYRSIYPIFGGHPYPCLFHCYGALT